MIQKWLDSYTKISKIEVILIRMKRIGLRNVRMSGSEGYMTIHNSFHMKEKRGCKDGRGSS